MIINWLFPRNCKCIIRKREKNVLVTLLRYFFNKHCTFTTENKKGNCKYDQKRRFDYSKSEIPHYVYEYILITMR